jgi:hypothetical protein
MVDRYAAFTELVQDTLAVIDSTALSSRRGESQEVKSRSRRGWQAAVEAQAALAHQDHAAAERDVTSMVNQMTHLARAAPWWPSHAAAAIADTVEYASGNHEVSSKAAQQAWVLYWAAHSTLAGLGLELLSIPDEERRALSERLHQADEAWIANWNNWHAAREESEQDAK